MTNATCTVYLSTETVPDDPILALNQALHDLPWLNAEHIVAHGNPRYDATTHAIEFDTDLTIIIPCVELRAVPLHELQAATRPQPARRG